MRKLMMVLATLFCTTPVLAQNPNPEPFRSGSIGVEFMRPIIDEDESDILMGSVFYARVPVGRTFLVAEVPFAVADDDTETSKALGNILLGLESVHGNVTLFGAARAPTAAENEVATFVGFLSDFLRIEAWAPNTWSVSAGARVHNRGPSGFGYDVGFGATVLLPEDVDKEWLLDYGVQLSYRPRAFGIAGGFAGRAIMSEAGADIGERTIHEGQLRLDYTRGRWRPVLDFRLPLDEDTREVLNGVVRIGVEYAIK